MKVIKPFAVNDEIPSNATFLHAKELDPDIDNPKHDVVFFYEVSIQKKQQSNKNDDEIKATIERVITYLNKKIGGKYTAKSKSHSSAIRARINEGAEPESFKHVIDNMCREWMDDPKMRPYLRPETLFSNKFWGYLSIKSGETMTQEAFAELDKLLEDGSSDE